MYVFCTHRQGFSRFLTGGRSLYCPSLRNLAPICCFRQAASSSHPPPPPPLLLGIYPAGTATCTNKVRHANLLRVSSAVSSLARSTSKVASNLDFSWRYVTNCDSTAVSRELSSSACSVATRSFSCASAS